MGPYEILSPLGAGGMGEVYKAKDTRLDRTVAIKVLPSHLSANAELRERFEREARTVSSLNHPNICTLHDIGNQGGIDFLVMEYMEGETLADRLKKGALPLQQALQHGIEMADALDKAHCQGVVHRDLKPGNIMLTKSGAKLLDFGLAKLRHGPQEGAPDLSTLATEAKPLTEKGSILGTFQYMAPEQLEGKDVDGRTDIFAFGAVLYEMVTGRKAFEGKSQASLIGAIMNSEPQPMSELQPVSPRSLEWSVKRCLAKDPDERWQSARDLTAELGRIAEGGSEAGLSARVTDGGPRSRLLWGVAGLLLGALVAGLASLKLSTDPSRSERQVMRFQIPLAPNHDWGQSGLDISPDGSRIAYVVSTDDHLQLYIRRMDQPEPTPMAGTEGARAPFFSPDGQWVGFWADGNLQKVSVAGGLPLTLCDSESMRGASWGADDVIVFGTAAKGLFEVPAGGGRPVALTTPNQNERAHRWPQLLPGEKAVLFTTWGGAGARSVAVLSRETGEVRTLIESGADARYVPTGHLVYRQLEGQVLGVPFDISRLQIAGAPVPLIVEEVAVGNLAVSARDTLVYATTTAFVPNSTLVWVDREGRESPLMAKPRSPQMAGVWRLPSVLALTTTFGFTSSIGGR
jgi:serine/threonine protein kinase